MKKFLRNKKWDNWELCKSCGGERILHDAPLWKAILLNDLGYVECTNCGKIEKIP